MKTHQTLEKRMARIERLKYTLNCEFKLQQTLKKYLAKSTCGEIHRIDQKGRYSRNVLKIERYL